MGEVEASGDLTVADDVLASVCIFMALIQAVMTPYWVALTSDRRKTRREITATGYRFSCSGPT